MTDAPDLADALPAAEHHCLRAVAHLEGRPARGGLLDALVALLEAAGGPDVGNGVRAHLERAGAAAPARWAADRSRDRVLLAAVRLHREAERDLRDRLCAAGLPVPAPRPDGGPPAPGRPARGEHVDRVLAERRVAVDRVLLALAGGDLPDGPVASAHWRDALVDALPPSVSG